MSKNHQFYEFDDQIVERWVKTPAHMISGKRVNPYNPVEHIDFVLRTHRDNFDFQQHNQMQYPDVDSKRKFVYEDEVLELYTDTEAKLFRRLNRNLIERGLLKPYQGKARDTDMSNLLSDDDVQEIAMIKTLNGFKSKLKAITSVTTLDRIMVAVKANNRAISFLSAIEAKRDELNRK